MPAPFVLKADYSLPATAVSKTCYLSVTLPGTNYTVVADFGYDAGGWYVTNKTTTSFVINVHTAPVGSAQPFTIQIVYDASHFEQ